MIWINRPHLFQNGQPKVVKSADLCETEHAHHCPVDADKIERNEHQQLIDQAQFLSTVSYTYRK
jgi:hypothetical protein